MSQISSWMKGHCGGRKWEITVLGPTKNLRGTVKNANFRLLPAVSLAQQSKRRLEDLKLDGGQPLTLSRNRAAAFGGRKQPKIRVFDGSAKIFRRIQNSDFPLTARAVTLHPT